MIHNSSDKRFTFISISLLSNLCTKQPLIVSSIKLQGVLPFAPSDLSPKKDLELQTEDSNGKTSKTYTKEKNLMLKPYHIIVQDSNLTSMPFSAEEESDPNRTPTRRNILAALEWLTKGCQSGDSLVFYYAGHGSHVPDGNGDEKDGFDEALCPVDYSVCGKILDDEINAIMVAPLPHGATLHSIMDTCFSGTLLDLPFLCRIDRGGFYKWEDHHPSHASSYGGTSGGKAICISACDDHQNSADTSAFTGNSIGALTYSFIQAVQSARKLSYGDLLDNMRKIVRDAHQQQGLNAPFASSTSQEPQLSSSTRFEIYSKAFKL